MRPYELQCSIHNSNLDTSKEGESHIFYHYKMVNKHGEVVERKSGLRQIMITDPNKYEGAVIDSPYVYRDTKEVFVVNGKVIKIDSNFMRPFEITKLGTSNVFIGSLPITIKDYYQLEDNQISAVLFIDTEEEEQFSGIDWDTTLNKLLKNGVKICKKLTIEDDNTEQLF